MKTLKQVSNAEAEAISQDRCNLCGAPVISLHCKILCTRCGYKRDCSDP
jgi:hypothetical protein